ncbi:uncharacterized protein LOC132260056 isoform X2 [Phlebotomus argentipes]|nr:uncharacterized protein LOC132260056 isoform X2 [Phlebotomus argentipes]
MAGDLGIGSIIPQSHDTYPNFMRPIQFEKEVMLHLCLRAEEMQCPSFSVAYEFRRFGCFDDIGLEFEYSGTFYTLLFQVKHSTKDTPLRDVDFTEEKRGNPFFLDNFSKSVPENGIQTNRTCKFLLLLNRNVAFNQVETIPEEDDDGIRALFVRLFGTRGRAMRLQSEILVKNRKGEEILIDNEYFLRNFVICCNLPPLEDVRAMNDQLFRDLYQNDDVDFAEKMRRRVFEALQVDSLEEHRPTLNKDFFRELIGNSERHHDFYS